MDSRNAESLRILARAFMGAGKFEAALGILSGLEDALPEDAFARRNRVACLLRLEKYAEAEDPARRLATDTAYAEPGDRAAALFHHAHALWGMGKMDECGSAVERYARELARETEERSRGKA